MRALTCLGVGAGAAGLLLLGAVTAAPASAVQDPHDMLLPNLDVRDSAKVAMPAAAARLEASLGAEGFVETDPQTGGVAFVGRTDGYLTGPSDAPAADIISDYVAANVRGIGLRAADLSTLAVDDSYTSDDGVTHVTFRQSVAGLESYDTYLQGHVDAKGRLINVSGAPARGLAPNTTTPELGADEALAAARANVEGDAALPPVDKRGSGPSRKTTYDSYAESATLTVFAAPGQDRLAWKVSVLGDHDLLYQVAVDAVTGEILARQSMTAFATDDAQVWTNFPSQTQSPVTVNFGTDPTWLDRSAANGNQLMGNNTHTYVDNNGTNGYQAGEEVARNGLVWTYPTTFFNQAECPAFKCTWDSANNATKLTNRNAGAVGLFYLINHFHDHLLSAPIGFDEASRNFEHVNGTGQGVGNDAVLGEAQDSSGLNNANFATPPDGTSGRMQMFFWSGNGPVAAGPQYDVDGSPSADVVYHEYAHGLTNRLVGNGGGLGAFQSGAMGEGWSDFYALDLLVAEGDILDPAGPGDVWLGGYATGVPGIFGGTSRIRHQAIDCTVGADASKCPSHGGTAGTGGYTFGDLGKVGTTNGVHDGGEIWSQTLWDLRNALGRTNALKIITGGLRLSPANPSMLNMRDAILQAANVNGVNASTVWPVFAARGFGFFATTPSASANSATEDFSLPPDLLHVSTVVDDDAPRGDGDGKAEPGETLALSTTLQNLTANPISGVTGSVTADSGVLVTQGSSSWPTIGSGATAANDPDFAVTVPEIQPCGTTFTVTMTVNGPSGPVTVPAKVIGVQGTSSFTDATDVPKAIPDNNPAGVNSVFTFPGAGTVSDLDVRIGQLTHTWVGDLKITLTHDATTVVLTNRPGAGTNGSSGDNFVNLVFDDEATSPIEGIGSTGPFTGSFTPDQPLTAFDGHSLAGNWTLNVSDNASADTGTLQSWAMSPVTSCEVFALPTATSTAASGVTATGATLNGSVDANGKATDYRFEWGTSTAYGSTTAVTPAGAGGDPVAVSATLTGLAASTEYHARVVALRDGVVLATGADQAFTTSAAPVGGSGGAGTVDTTAPAVTIVKAPKKKVVTKKKSAKVKVVFTSEVGAAFQCRLDKKAFAACTSPFKAVAKSKPGKGKKHTISIVAADASGNTSAPLTLKFKVVRKR